jgi:hypothetical protein
MLWLFALDPQHLLAITDSHVNDPYAVPLQHHGCE